MPSGTSARRWKRVLRAPACDNRGVTEAEFLERFDRHLEVNSALLDDVRREVALSREEAERSREAHEDLRVFTREITTRNEKVWREVMVGLADIRRGIREDQAQAREDREQAREDREQAGEDRVGMRESLKDMRDAIRADTAAVLRLLDRLGESGSNA